MVGAERSKRHAVRPEYLWLGQRRRDQATRDDQPARLRRVNEAMRFMVPTNRVAFRCECGPVGCNQLIGLTRAEYNGVRVDPRRFALGP